MRTEPLRVKMVLMKFIYKMRSKVAKRILNKTPNDTKIFVRWYSDLIVRINELLREKELSQQGLAELLNKKPSEISKWLSGNHNFTLRSLAKIQAELDEPLFIIPKTQKIQTRRFNYSQFVMIKYPSKSKKGSFIESEHNCTKTKEILADVG